MHAAAGEPDLLYIDLHLVHEVTSPQAFDGLRLDGPRPCAGPTSPSRRWTTTCRPPASTSPLADPISAKQMEVLARELRGVRHPLLRDGRPRPGHRARHRPRAGTHAAGHDDRVRRQPHVDARRVRRARVRHRHERGRARARDADAAADAAGNDGGHRRRRRCPPASPPRTSCSRSSPASAPAAGSARSSSTAARAIRALSMEGRMTVCNMSIEAGARAGLDRTRRHDVRLPRRPARSRRRARRGNSALDDWRSLVTDDGAAFDKEVVHRRGDAAAARVVGHEPGPDVTDRRRRPRPRLVRRPDARESAQARARVHGPEGGHADPRHRGRHRVHRFVHELAHRGPARRRRGRRRAARCKRRRAHAGRARFDAR